VAALGFASARLAAVPQSEPASAAPIQVKVVIVAMYEKGEGMAGPPGEFQTWVDKERLDRVWAFPQGERALRTNKEGSVLGVVTGVGTIHSAATIMALGTDPRFDLRRAYWLVAGIAGVNPHAASLGSAAWAEWVVDGDLGHEIDAREMPPEWPTGHFPLRKKAPYELPVDPQEGQVFHLVPAFVDWAYRLTADTPLPDSEGLRRHRILYSGYPEALRPPFVLKGDNLAAMNFWHGRLMNDWATAWVSYHTGGAGRYVTSAMEDTGTLQSLAWLARSGRVDARRALVLRTASNYDMPWPGATASQSLAGEGLAAGYSGYFPALDAAYRVGSRVLHALLDGWKVYEERIPGDPPRTTG
jgi:purine nucleoside permease